MRQKLAKLMAVVGFFICAHQFDRVAQAASICECSGTVSTVSYVLPDPVCASHDFFYLNALESEGDCATWCYDAARFGGVQACVGDAGACDAGGEFPFDPPNWYFEGSYRWNHGMEVLFWRYGMC